MGWQELEELTYLASRTMERVRKSREIAAETAAIIETLEKLTTGRTTDALQGRATVQRNR
jgi:hypothetical protein